MRWSPCSIVFVVDGSEEAVGFWLGELIKDAEDCAEGEPTDVDEQESMGREAQGELLNRTKEGPANSEEEEGPDDTSEEAPNSEPPDRVGAELPKSGGGEPAAGEVNEPPNGAAVT